MFGRGARCGCRCGGRTAPPDVSLPVAFTVFRGEIFRAPRTWAEKIYPNLIYFNEVEEDGHFAAWGEPDLFLQELRAAFEPLRRTTNDPHVNGMSYNERSST